MRAHQHEFARKWAVVFGGHFIIDYPEEFGPTSSVMYIADVIKTSYGKAVLAVNVYRPNAIEIFNFDFIGDAHLKNIGSKNINLNAIMQKSCSFHITGFKQITSRLNMMTDIEKIYNLELDKHSDGLITSKLSDIATMYSMEEDSIKDSV